MPAQGVAIRPQRCFHRLEDRSLVEGEQVAGNVAIGGERFGGDDLVLVGDAEQPFVKGPVTEPAEGQAVARVVIVTDRPGNDMGGVDCGVTVRCTHTDTAKGATVGIGGDYGATKALIADGGWDYVAETLRRRIRMLVNNRPKESSSNRPTSGYVRPKRKVFAG